MVVDRKLRSPLVPFHSLAAAWGALCCLLIMSATVNSCWISRQINLCGEYFSPLQIPFPYSFQDDFYLSKPLSGFTLPWACILYRIKSGSFDGAYMTQHDTVFGTIFSAHFCSCISILPTFHFCSSSANAFGFTFVLNDRFIS